VCLVDRSRSVTQRRTDSRASIERALAEQKEKAERAGEDLCTIVFDDEVRRVFGPAPARGFRGTEAFDPSRSENAPGGTRLAEALEAARSLATQAARPLTTVVVLGDGTYTGRDPLPVLRELHDLGVAIERSDLPPPDRAELAVGPLSLPVRVEEGAPIVVDCEIFYAPGRGNAAPPGITVEVEHAVASGPRTELVEMAVPGSAVPDADGFLRWRLRCDVQAAEPGLNTIEVRPRLPTAGRGSRGFVRCGGRLVVGDASGARPGLPRLVAASGIDLVDLVATQGDRIAEVLGSLDAIVTSRSFPVGIPDEVLASFVRGGGGWLYFADDDFAPGFPPGDLCPLLPPERDPESRDIVLLVDRSGSMSGGAFETVRSSVQALIQNSPAGEAVELRFFSSRLSGPIPVKGVDDPREGAQILREAADRFLSGGGPGGSTALARSLEAFAVERERSAREALAFLISDGRDTVDADAKDRCAAIRSRLQAARARLVVIAAGEDPDRDLLSSLLLQGEELRAVGSLSDAKAAVRIREIFRRETSRGSVREGENLRVLPAAALLDPDAPASVGAEVLRAQKPEGSAGWPAIQRYVRARSARGAEVLWSSERGEPLLALQRVGLGLAAACAFGPLREGENRWAERPDLWAPLLRTLARGQRTAPPRLRVEGDELTLEDLPEDTPAELEARVYAASEASGEAPACVIELSAPTSGVDPRRVRRGHWPALATLPVRDLPDGSPRLELHPRGRVVPWTPIVLPFVTPRSPEDALPRPRWNAGAFPASSSRAVPSAAPARRPLPAAPWVLVSGLLLLTIAALAGSFSRPKV